MKLSFSWMIVVRTNKLFKFCKLALEIKVGEACSEQGALRSVFLVHLLKGYWISFYEDSPLVELRFPTLGSDNQVIIGQLFAEKASRRLNKILVGKFFFYSFFNFVFYGFLSFCSICRFDELIDLNIFFSENATIQIERIVENLRISEYVLVFILEIEGLFRGFEQLADRECLRDFLSVDIKYATVMAIAQFPIFIFFNSHKLFLILIAIN